VEFVSRDDFGPLGGDWEGKLYDDVKQAAAALSDQVQRKGHDLRIGVFYDPVTYGGLRSWGESSDNDDDGRSWKSTPEKAKAESKRLLRLQVLDFVNWLKAQGAI
jgi:hypothetical protein